MSRVRLAIAVAALSFAGLAVAPLGAEASMRVYTGSDYRGGGNYAGALGSNGSDEITVTSDKQGRILFSDPEGVNAEEGCKQVSETSASCYTFAGFFVVLGYAGNDEIIERSSTPVRLSIRGGDGNDTIRSVGPLSYADGEKGDDTLVGGRGRQAFYGGEGEDTLRTLSGHDYLNGEDGIDSLFGGEGRDLLHAEDRDKDAAVNCGPGNDLALISRLEPLPPRSCERYGHVHNGDVVGTRNR